MLGISSVGRTQKRPVILRGFLCLESLKVMLTIELKSALSGAPSVPPNRAAQGCQRHYHCSIEACCEVEILPWSSWLCSCKKRYNHQILLYHLMHNSIEKENPIQDSEDQEILAKLLVEEKKIQNAKAKQVEGAGLTLQLHSTDTPTENWRVYILMIFVWLTC